MNCTTCGKENHDGVSFCEFCGADMRPKSISNINPEVARAVPAQPAVPSAAEVAQIGKSLINFLSFGDKLIAVGVVAATFGFFLPWVSTSNMVGALSGILGQYGSSIPGLGNVNMSMSGIDLSKFVGAVYLVLLLAITSGFLLYASMKATTAKKLLISGFQVMIGSLFGPGIILELLFLPLFQTVAGAGLWLLGIGFSAIAAGGLITIASLGKTAR
ncbi:hypothetical protein [Acidithiobacillus sp.]|uniref:zinc ribbon domain-containing protein n=1 Tax=Acidithiobacillus sp. TaxID=1872118 RepID=UPI003D080F30